MRGCVLIFLGFCLLISSFAEARVFTLTYDENNATANCAKVRAAYCKGVNCVDWKHRAEKTPTANCDQTAQTIDVDVPLKFSEVPASPASLTIRFRLTLMDTDGNETDGDITTTTVNR